MCFVQVLCKHLKGNMHHKYDLIWKDAFHNAHIAAGFYFWKIFTISKEALKMLIFCRLTFPPPLAHISSSFGSNYLLPTQQLAAYTYQFKEEEIWAWGGGNMRTRRRKYEQTKIAALLPLSLWCKIFKNKSQRQYNWHKKHHLSSHHVYDSYSL